MDEINSMEQQLLCIKKQKLKKFYNTYLLTAKVNQKNSPGRFIVSSIAQNQSARTTIILFTQTTFSSKVMRICGNDDIVWTLMKTLNNDLAENIPTWSAYNSILADKKPTNTHCILPIIQGTTTDWSTLYSAIAASAKLNVNIGQSSKTIISLDLQLYMKCIQLQSIGNINQNFIFRMGELYTVFCTMKVLGKIIDASGLDMSLSIADIYGTTTVEQVKSGIDVYRSFEGYLTLYLSLYKIYLQKFIDTNPLIERDIRSGIINSIENLKNYKHHETANYKMNHKETIDFLENINFHGLQDMFDKSLTNQAKYFRNFMKLFELLLLFTRATRQQ